MTTKKEKQNLLDEIGRKNIMTQDLKDTKFYQYKEEINGHEYIFQYCGKRKALQITDECTTDNNTTSKEKLVDSVLRTIIVSPSVTIDTFDEEEYIDDFDRVTEVANIIFSGKFRNNEKLKKG